MNSRELIRELREAGWRQVRVRGSHHQFSHPDHPGAILTVPPPKKDLGKGLE